MNNIFYKPYMGDGKPVYFPYTREKLTERPIFPAYVYDGGAFLFINDVFDAADSDRLLKLILSGELFAYWTIDGKFDWSAVYKKWTRCGGLGNEWEAHYWLNRLYILLPLAQQFCRTGDRTCSDLWYKLLFDWFENNPYDPTQVGTDNNRIWRDMQVAWRTINIVHSIFLFGREDVFTEEQWQRIYALVKLHAAHLYKESVVHVRTRITGNHKLQIAMADIMVGCLFPEFENSAEYVEAGRLMVAENLKQAIKKDGVSHENAVSYAHFIARLYLEAELLLRLNGHETVAGLAESIQKQYEYLYQYSSPDGLTMQIGDSYAMDAIADIEFVSSFYPLTFPREKKPILFAESQLAVLRNRRFDVYIDAMRPNPNGNGYTWHQHYGKPTFAAYIDGRPVIVDRGCPNYNRSDLYIPLYIESGHNVITCDEIPLAQKADVIPTDAATDIRITDYRADGDCQSLTVRNTVSDPGGRSYTWVRVFELREDSLRIRDTVTASEKMHFTSYLYVPGFHDLNCRLEPVMPSQEMRSGSGRLDIRADDRVESILTDSPFLFECRPCINCRNRIDYADALIRGFDTDHIEENTVIRIEDR